MSEQKVHVSEKKKKIVGNLTDLIKNKRTILIASIKDIPASQFQKIVKKLRGSAIVKIPKKNLIFRAIDNSGNEIIKKLKEKIKNSVAILFSDVDSFELAAELIQNKSPVKAKPGQEAPEEIIVSAGPTDLMPGPAISELGALGIQVQIDKGKITIREPKVITKKGEKISVAAADIMNKLNIKPFSIGFTPLAAFDTKEGKLYLDIKIDREKTLEELKTSFGRALPFAVEIGYMCEDTIKFLISKAGRHEKVLEKFTESLDSEDKKVDNEEKTDEQSDINDNNSNKLSEASENKKDDIQQENSQEENK